MSQDSSLLIFCCLDSYRKFWCQLLKNSLDLLVSFCQAAVIRHVSLLRGAKSEESFYLSSNVNSQRSTCPIFYSPKNRSGAGAELYVQLAALDMV